MIAGIGCRSGSTRDDILAALDAALVAVGRSRGELSALCAPEEKRAEAGLAAAAVELERPLVLLPRHALLAHGAAAITHSSFALEHYGVPSVAEASALAGAAEHGTPRLLGPRQVFGSATCALATFEEVRP